MKLEPLHKVFEIGHGNKLDYNKMSTCGPSDDAIVFVGRTAEKNGFVGFVERIDTHAPYEAGLITVALGGSALSSFVQDRPFYTGQNIDVLRPRLEMSLEEKLYYCLCIQANAFRYSTFGREANRTLKNLSVPAREDVPSWVHGAAETAIRGAFGKLAEIVSAAESRSTAVSVNGAGVGVTIAIANRDEKAAIERLDEVNNDPSELVSGEELDQELNQLLER